MPLDTCNSRTMACLFALAASVAIASPAAAQTPFSGLAGSWSGGGQIKLNDGTAERLSCRASYNPKENGASMGMSIRCASQSYKIELRSSLQYAGGQVTGTWEERSHNVGGPVSGRASNGSVNVSFGGDIAGSMSVSFTASTQRVSISTGGAGFASVSLNLSRG